MGHSAVSRRVGPYLQNAVTEGSAWSIDSRGQSVGGSRDASPRVFGEVTTM